MRTNRTHRANRRRGVTLIELVVALLTVGFISAVAAPKMFYTMSTARTNAAKSNLKVIRNAIEQYKANDPNNAAPPAATLATALQPYLKGPFPACPMGNQNANVANSTANPLTNTTTGEGWVYNQ